MSVVLKLSLLLDAIVREEDALSCIVFTEKCGDVIEIVCGMSERRFEMTIVDVALVHVDVAYESTP